MATDIFEKLFYSALRIRLIEERIVQIYPTDKIQSPVHLSVGQEHHIAALCHALGEQDQLFTTYRNHALYLARGGDLKAMLAELFGKNTGLAQGKAGSMHLCFPEAGLMGSSAIVGSIFSHALGAAYATKLENKPRVVVAVSGEGATEEGTFHESLNFAALKQLPLIFIIENNGLAIHAPLHIRQSYQLEKLAAAYGIEYFRAEDGFDMESIYAQTQDIRSQVARRNRPVVFEIKTYRYKAHVGIQDDHNLAYRDQIEYKQWLDRDPLIHQHELIKKFLPQIEAEIQEAVAYAEAGAFPPAEVLLKDVY